MKKDKLKILANNIRKKVLEMLYESHTCHLGSNMSCVDIMVALYWKIMKPKDKFILSKGHAVATLYATLAERGILNEKLLKTYCKMPTELIGHANRSVKGIEASTGSLGHGLPMATGMALADRKRKIYCLMSDAEMECGTTWESALFVAHHKLNNLVIIVDYNKWQACGKTNEVLNLEPLAEKWQAFNWEVKIIDGHNFKEIEKALLKKQKKPYVIIANTIKGRGVSYAENKMKSHYMNLTEEQNEKSILQLSC